ncbi:electron transfer flavoprotein-quinone oxidoreductase [Fodinibius salinus]|uniref:Electron transfer flavoprotein-quinone oxidoreductase n=1 Tax=Fodinibius salinus TaxID=860790 RepID=A0A5D3YN95_9BACT|nr:FAD-dependent oxidoreductase [Fodinibius salinus]TYP95645.1 electron transfer flavoprotein-quinone oxidoreductase [Fodinibius salinus]
MDEKFDCIIVGAGIAGLAAAMTLARNNMKFLLIEKGEFAGSKNVSGGVLWGSDLAKLVPEYWKEEDGGWERFINHRRLTFMDEESTFSVDFKSSHFNETPYSGVVVLRSKFDRWLAGKVQEEIDNSDYAMESFIATNIKVDEVLMEDDKAVGIRTGDEEFHADSVIISEGVNNLLTRQVGLQDDYVPADHMLTGIKEVIRYDQNVLEDRFQLNGLSGMSNEFVGYATDGVEGGGFLYTNRDSISLGLVAGIKDMREKEKSPHDLLNTFKQHPVIQDTIRGGEVIEYSAHVVSSGDKRVMPKELYKDGVLLCGESANLLMNAGKAIQGMDFAMRSGILGAETIVKAKERGDFTSATLKEYKQALADSYVMKDINNFQDAVHMLHNPTMIQDVPNLICDFGRKFFTIDNEPTKKSRKLMQESIKKHSSYWDLMKIGFKGAKSL